MGETVAPGTRIGDYRVTGLIAQGGMATVYLADRLTVGGQAALKILPPQLAADPPVRERFMREARYAASLDHPHITRVYGAGEEGGLLYLALQYVPGVDLRALLTLEHRLEPQQTVEILAQIADALDYGHARGILHRDVKPGNILIASGEGAQSSGHCYLTDLGLSKNPSADTSPLTVPGDFVGTTQYTAPEQILGRSCDHRVDVYSLGCVLYECLIGEPPFAAARDAEVLYGHIQEPPPKPSDRRPEVPAALDDVIARALAKDPEARFGTCSELIDAARAAILSAVLRLHVTAGNAAGAEIEVGDELTFGRHAGEEGRLADDAEISRLHARVWRDDADAYVIEDLGSTNGTFVNGRRIDGRETLAAGDTIEVGGTTLMVVLPVHTRPAETVLAPHQPFVRDIGEAIHAETPSPPAAPAAVEPTAFRPPPRAPEVTLAPPVEAAPPAPAEPEPSAPPRLSLRLEVDWQSAEVLLRLGEGSEPISIVYEDGRWRVAPS